MDKDTMDYITDYNNKHAKPEHYNNALFLAKHTEEIAIIVSKAYNIGETEGTTILASIIEAIIMVNSKNLDQSLNRIDKLYKEVRLNLIDIDKEANK